MLGPVPIAIFNRSHLQIAKIKHLQASEVFELVLEARQPRNPEPVRVEIELLQCLEGQHLLEVETVLWLDPVERQAQPLEFWAIDGLDKVAKVVDDAHADQLQTLQVLKAKDPLVQMREDALG